MSTVGYATLQIIPSLDGLSKTVQGELSGSATGAASEKAGRGIGAKVMGGLKVAGLAAAATAGAALTTALVKGWGRLTAIDDAKAKLSGLGHSAVSVQNVMDSALASVKGTAFGLGDAATIAAGTVAAGVKPGKDLTRTLKLVADAATIGGSSMSDMGAIFNKVAATGKVQGEVIQQLGERGIPILQLLGKELGKTPAEVSELAAAGEIGFETFQKAMEKGLGGAALKSGDTIKGSLANMWAAFGRFGEKLLVGVAPIIQDVFGGLSGWLDRIGGMVSPWTDKISGAITGLFNILFKGDFTGSIFGFEEDSDLVAFLFKIRDAVAGLPDLFAQIWVSAKPFLAGLKDQAFEKAASIFGKLKEAAVTLWPAVKDLATWAAAAVGAVAVTAWSVALDVFDALATIVADVLAPAFAGLVGWIKDNESLVTVLAVAVGAGVIAFKAWQIGVKAVSAVTKAWSAVQAAFNAVMSANPIMLAVIAIAALVAGAVIAYKKVDWFRDAVDKVWKVLKDNVWPVLQNVAAFLKDVFATAISTVADVWSNVLWPALRAVGSFMTDTLWPALKNVGDYIGSVMSPIIKGLADTWDNALKPALNLVTSLFTKVLWPILKTVGGFIADVFMVQVKLLAWVWSNVLWPALKAVAGFIGDKVLPIVGSIASAFATVALWVGQRIGDIVGFVVGIPGRIGATISGLWNGMIWGITVAKNWIGDRISDMVSFVTGLPGRISSAASGMWDGIKNAFKSALNWVIDKWNGLKFKVPSVEAFGMRIGGFELGVPSIPRFHTGGTVDGRFSGDEVVARLLRNETVLTPDQLARLGSSAGGTTVTVVNQFSGPVAGRDGERWVSDMVASAARRGIRAA